MIADKSVKGGDPAGKRFANTSEFYQFYEIDLPYGFAMDKRLRNERQDFYLNGKPKVRYPDLCFIPFLSLAIGYIMVQLGSNATWLAWESDPKVRISIVSSIGCTATTLIVIAVHNRILDWLLPWRNRPFVRLGAQYIFCVFLPNLLVTGWQFFFFRYIGAPERMQGYMDEDFPAVRWMLMVWNLFYLGAYLYAVPAKWRPNRGVPHGGNDPDVEKAPAMGRKTSNIYNDQDLAYWKNRVAIFMSENKKTSAVLDNGNKKEYAEPAKFFQNLVGNQFYMVRSGKLVNRDFIDKVYDDGRFYTIILKKPNHRIDVATIMDGKAAFSSWWGGKILHRIKRA